MLRNVRGQFPICVAILLRFRKETAPPLYRMIFGKLPAPLEPVSTDKIRTAIGNLTSKYN
jgi:hypothetical protein